MYEKCHKINMVLLKLANIDEASTHGEITSLLMASLCFLRSLTTGSTPFSHISHIARQSESRPTRVQQLGYVLQFVYVVSRFI